ncbi:hypothetical protein D3C85_1747030 [compost metagenome]
MHFKGVGAGIVLPGIDILLECFAVDCLSGTHYQASQQGKLFRGDFYRLRIADHLLSL